MIKHGVARYNSQTGASSRSSILAMPFYRSGPL
jgi:hypothetical protein